jgi:hypothetical protein
MIFNQCANMKLKLSNLRSIIEVAMSSANLSSNVRLAETGNKWSHFIYLLDADKMPDIEAALLGGISVSEYGGPWGVGSVSAVEGYGPLLYRLAMEWVRDNGNGRGLTKNRGGETSDAAKRVWDKFKSRRRDVGSDLVLVGDPIDNEFIATSRELDKLQSKAISLTPDQESIAWNMLTSLEIGSQRRYDEEDA